VAYVTFDLTPTAPGLELVRKLDKLGCRASHTAELRFDGVRVPGGNLLGGEEKLQHKLAKAREAVEGGKRSSSATLGTFEQTRPMVAAQAIGIARAALEYATTYAPSARRSADQSSTTRASLFRWRRSPPKSMRRGC
jgi:alkylation response protein AidB-like acyl-CoA dehydrogenase